MNIKLEKYRVVYLESEKGWGSKIEHSGVYEVFEHALDAYKRAQPDSVSSKSREVPDYYYISTGIEQLTEYSDGSRVWKHIFPQ